MNYADFFLPSNKPLAKVSYKAVEEDVLFLNAVFPETGFRTYFPGFLFRKLVQELKHLDINSYEQRSDHEATRNLNRFLSDIRFIRQSDERTLGRAVESIHPEGPRGS